MTCAMEKGGAAQTLNLVAMNHCILVGYLTSDSHHVLVPVWSAGTGQWMSRTKTNNDYQLAPLRLGGLIWWRVMYVFIFIITISLNCNPQAKEKQTVSTLESLPRSSHSRCLIVSANRTRKRNKFIYIWQFFIWFDCLHFTRVITLITWRRRRPG